MTTADLVVVLVGLPAGYWLVNFLTRGGDASRRGARASPARPAPPAPAPAPAAWHDVLGVAPDAGVDEIRAAWRHRVAEYHPDKVATLGVELRELATRRSAEINDAYRAALAERGVGEP